MTAIANFINISITRETQGVSRATLEIPLILADVHEFFERTRQYSSISAVGDDFLTTSNVYLMAAKIFSQSPHPKYIKVGRMYANKNAKQTLTPDLAPTAGTFTITLGTETTAAIAYDANAAAIKAALELLTAVTEVTVTGSMATAVVVEFTGADANKHFATMSVTESLTTTTAVTVTVQQYGSANESFATALNAIVNYDNDWYMLFSESNTAADLEDIAAWVQTQRKMYLAKSEDAAIIATGSSDVASILKAANYTRSAVFFSEQSGHQLDCGLGSLMLPKQAGSATFAYKTVEGVTVDSYTDSERAFAIAKKANIYHTVGGVPITEQGTTAQGEYIDVMMGIDWMQARMEEDIFQALTEADKIPFNDVGIGVIVGIIKSVLDRAYRQGIINNDYVIDAPLAADVSAVDKAARTLPDVTFSATLQGAIHFVEVRGTVSL